MLLVLVREFQDEIATAIELGFDLSKATAVPNHLKDIVEILIDQVAEFYFGLIKKSVEIFLCCLVGIHSPMLALIHQNFSSQEFRDCISLSI